MKYVIEVSEDKLELIKMAAAAGIGDWVYRIVAKGKPLDQEPTTKNCESCEYYGSHHEVCNYCYKCSLWTEQEPRWIPVSERLPENRNQEVLISLEWGIDIGRYSDGEWHSEWINHYDDGNVLAWMPLPQPYREVEE